MSFRSVAGFLSERKNRALAFLVGVFLLTYFIPFTSEPVASAIQESFLMLSDYVREHVLWCLVPAFFLAGAIMIFLDRQSIIRYLGPDANKSVAYGVASVSGAILAVCSCTVLPIFKGIYKKGAGIGPAVSFLYSGPAINVLAVILTTKVLGVQLGIARAVGAVVFAIAIGFCMHVMFRNEDAARVTNAAMFHSHDDKPERGVGKTAVYMTSMIGILVFINWSPSNRASYGWDLVYRVRYVVVAAFALVLVYALKRWFKRSELADWVRATRDFAVQILPLLFGGVMVAGFLLGRPGHSALIPEQWIANLVGGNAPAASLVASIAGALMYFATLTEVPIMQGLIGAGMGNGPALALLLAGPSLSLPSMLVISGELGWRKTVIYIGLVVTLSTTAGVVYGSIVG